MMVNFGAKGFNLNSVNFGVPINHPSQNVESSIGHIFVWNLGG